MFATTDPRAFLAMHPSHAIFDEAQRVPQLFSYLQGTVDKTGDSGQFILCGSQSFVLMDAISQSLAGRVATLDLLPFSQMELQQARILFDGPSDWILKGGYPRIYDKRIEPADFFPDYLRTYIERDVRHELGVTHLAEFARFLRLCAARVGEVLNVAGLARDCGIDPKTADRWLSVLEESFVIFRLRPFYSNIGKRLIKSPKLYFFDTGLASNLLGLEEADDVRMSASYDHLFENAVIAEVMKASYEKGRIPQLSYWRDSNRNEIDLLVEKGAAAVRAIEIKSSSTFNSRFFDTLSSICPALGIGVERRAVVYGGCEGAAMSPGKLVGFQDVRDALA